MFNFIGELPLGGILTSRVKLKK